MQEEQDFTKSFPFKGMIISEWADGSEWMNTLADQYLADIKMQRNGSRFKYWFKIVLLNCIIAENEGMYCGVALDKDRYHSYYFCKKKKEIVKSKLSEMHIKYAHMKYAVEWLSANNLIEMYKGSNLTGLTTQIKATPSLVALIDGKAKEICKTIKFIDSLCPISMSGKMKEGKKVKSIDMEFPETKFSKRREILLNAWYKLANKTTITYDNTPIVNPKLISMFCRGEITNELIYGGRFYCLTPVGSNWQSIKRELRSSILINGKKTVELDFKALHISMLYAQRGEELNFDPYIIDGFSRSFCKTVIMVLINCQTRTKFCQWIRNEAFTTNCPECKKFIADMDDNIARFSKGIEVWVCSDAGVKLQMLDSQIAEMVVGHFTDKGILTLPVHDSFVIDEAYEDELRAMMHMAYTTIMGKSIGIDKKGIDKSVTISDICTDGFTFTNDITFDDGYVDLGI